MAHCDILNMSVSTFKCNHNKRKTVITIISQQKKQNGNQLRRW